MRIEKLFRTTFENNMQNFAKCEGKWLEDKNVNEKWLVSGFKICEDILTEEGNLEEAEEHKWENVKDRLEDGKVVADMFLIYRLVSDNPKCPICGASYEEGTSALSRKDSTTEICSDCGTMEAFANLREENSGIKIV